MSHSIAVSDPDTEWADRLKRYLEGKFYSVDLASSGKDCQLKAFKNQYQTIILDLATQRHSAFEVLRYLKVNRPGTRVILTSADKFFLEDMGLKEKDLRLLGVSKVIYKPCEEANVLKFLEDNEGNKGWRDLDPKDKASPEVECQLEDSLFTRVRIDDFFSGCAVIFDCYIRLAKNKYIKVLHRGDYFDQSQLTKYQRSQNVEYIYFLTKDRTTYINFMNETLDKIIKSKKVSPNQKFSHTKNLAEKYIEEIYSAGIRPELIAEGKKMAQNMYTFLQQDPDLGKLLNSINEHDESAEAHLFLVSFIACVICGNLEWSSPRTAELVTMGSMLHDIGKIRLPEELLVIPYGKMSEAQKKQYQRHPELGVEMLNRYRDILEPVKQIVYQHHEYVNGQGYPKGLAGSRIYPLAKIVTVANEFVDLILTEKVSSTKGLKLFIADREKLMCYDPSIVKALFQGFIKK